MRLRNGRNVIVIISEKQIIKMMSLLQSVVQQPIIIEGMAGIVHAACDLLNEIHNQQSEELKDYSND